MNDQNRAEQSGWEQDAFLTNAEYDALPAERQEQYRRNSRTHRPDEARIPSERSSIRALITQGRKRTVADPVLRPEASPRQ